MKYDDLANIIENHPLNKDLLDEIEKSRTNTNSPETATTKPAALISLGFKSNTSTTNITTVSDIKFNEESDDEDTLEVYYGNSDDEFDEISFHDMSL